LLKNGHILYKRAKNNVYIIASHNLSGRGNLIFLFDNDLSRLLRRFRYSQTGFIGFKKDNKKYR